MLDSHINIEQSKRYHGGALLMAFLMILSMLPWFYYFYQPNTNTQFLIAVGGALLSFLLASDSFVFSKENLVIFFVFLIAAFLGTTGNTNAYVGTFLRAVPFFFFLNANNLYKCAIIKVFNKLFSWIIAVSLFLWILFLIGVPMSHTIVSNSEFEHYTYENYFFFLRSISHLDKEVFPRFCSIFLEPGYIACIMVFIMFLDNYNFRKRQNIIYLIALFFTFSLAGWLFFFISFIPFLRDKGRIKWYYFLGLTIITVAFVYLNYYTPYDNLVKDMVGKRIEVQDGEMAGYNRSNDNLDYYWEHKLIPEGKLLMGLREEYAERYDFGTAVELRAYIVRFGLIAAIVYLLFMYICYKVNKSSFGFWYALVAFLFVFRGYHIMFSTYFLFIYVGGLAILKWNSFAEQDGIILEESNN